MNLRVQKESTSSKTPVRCLMSDADVVDNVPLHAAAVAAVAAAAAAVDDSKLSDSKLTTRRAED
jgi:hypothetical protein